MQNLHIYSLKLWYIQSSLIATSPTKSTVFQQKLHITSNLSHQYLLGHLPNHAEWGSIQILEGESFQNSSQENLTTLFVILTQFFVI